MTLEELWQLFPIFLVANKSEWSNWFLQEKKLLEEKLQNLKFIRIEHIGSTAVPNIYAKDIVDILIEVKNNGFDDVVEALQKSDYILMYKEESRAAFNKGYTEDGYADEVFHIHVRKENDTDEVYFRDYLLDHPKTAKKYEALKLELSEKYEHNRDGYTSAKTEFIQEVTKKAKEIYKNKD